MKHGKVVNEDLLTDLTDKELVSLFEDMLWSRALNDRSTILARQGRLGFFGPTVWSRSESNWFLLCI